MQKVEKVLSMRVETCSELTLNSLTCVRRRVAGAAAALCRFPPVLSCDNLLLLEVAQHPSQQLRVQPQLLRQPRRLRIPENRFVCMYGCSLCERCT